MKILVADDDPGTRLQLSVILEQVGFEVLLAWSGTEAAEIWQREQPPLVITDWFMPGMGGEDLCKFIREEAGERYTYVIVITGMTRKTPAIIGLGAGADDYIKKPFDTQELLLRVQAGKRVVELERSLADKVTELEGALSRVRTLEGILPTCSYCRKICDDEGNWCDLELYVRERTAADFSHGSCPDCYEKHISPELYE